MCCEKTKCERPKELKGKAEERSPEQIKKCHGDVKTHPLLAEEGRAERRG
jgi:hypothetical protein